MLKKPGRVESALLKWLTRQATVSAVTEVSAHVRMVELEGEDLKGAEWAPGDKIQMELGGLFSFRTFTPICWDRANGGTKFLAYLHGDGPASQWAAALKPGDRCAMYGPRRSIDLGSAARPLVLFGDETSFGLALSLSAMEDGASGASFLFEVTSKEESAAVLAALGIPATPIERLADDAHLGMLEEAFGQLAERTEPAQFVFTGKASSIQRLSQAAKRRGFTPVQIKSKAYWAPGKTGLD